MWSSGYKSFYIFITTLLFLSYSCSPDKSTVKTGEKSHIDSLLIDAIKASNQHDFNIALSKLNRVIDEAKALEDHRNQVLGTINLGLLYLIYNSEEEALNYFLSSIDLAKNYDQEALLNTIYNNIGIVYSSNDNLDKAEEYFEKALDLSRERKEPSKIAINLINLGSVKETKKELVPAKEYFQQALSLFKNQKDTNNISVVLNNMGNIYFQNENYLEAKSHYHQAIQLRSIHPDKRFLPLFQHNYGKVLYQFEQYDSASTYFNAALDSFLVLKNTEKIIDSYNWLAKINDTLGNQNMAINYYNECLNWKDTLLNEKRKNWVSQLQMKYEFGKKEKEIEFLHQKAQQEKLIWGGSILAVLIFSILLFYSLKVKNTNLRQKNIILKKEQELASLEMTKNQLLQEKLKQKLEMKNRELASKALHLVNKNEILTSITGLLDQIKVQNEPKNAQLVNNAKRTIDRNINLDEQWEDFKIHFEEVHSGFFTQIMNDYPNLTQTDLKLSAYLLINLDSKEIAQISNISPDSVRKRKQRLREKLNLTKDQDIRILLNQYESV